MFEGYFDGKGNAIVTFNGKELDPKKSQAIINHSPTGFNWGYGGSGPAQLALAILLEVCDKSIAVDLYQHFKWEVIAKLPIDKKWSMSVNYVKDWVQRKLRDYEKI